MSKLIMHQNLCPINLSSDTFSILGSRVRML